MAKPRSDNQATGLRVRSGVQAGSVIGTLRTTTQTVVAAIPPKLLSFEA